MQLPLMHTRGSQQSRPLSQRPHWPPPQPSFPEQSLHVAQTRGPVSSPHDAPAVSTARSKWMATLSVDRRPPATIDPNTSMFCAATVALGAYRLPANCVALAIDATLPAT